MKKVLTLLILLFVFQITYGKRISENSARNVGQTFLTKATQAGSLKNASDLQLVYTATSNSIDASDSAEPIPLFYVFNGGVHGFVIVAGDDNVTPVLGYSDQGAFNPDSIPQNVAKWLEGYKSEIRYIIENDIEASKEIYDEWQNLSGGGLTGASAKSGTGVNPLMQTRWSQSPYYNDLCPGGSVTGCVATAMAQIMKFWNYPATGSGFYSYDHHSYGTLSANFSSTTYEWGSMPNAVTSRNDAVATLMYQVGVSVDMNYSPNSSGAYVITAQSPVTACSEYALKTYFGYRNSLQGVQRAYYDQAQWINLLKTELNAGRPVLYAGFGSGGGHCFVTDGYDNNNYFHLNWGWGGYYDGFFSINALNPSGLGTGGGSGGYNSGHQAVIGIEPPAQTQTLSLELYDFVTPSARTIAYGQSFSVSTNIANAGTTAFNGDYAAAIFDSQYNFVDFVQVLSGYSLQPGYTYSSNLVFSTPELFGMLPGTYYVGIFYRPTGGNWYLVEDYGNYTNPVPMTVVNENDIELYSAITVTPGLILTQGKPASVNLNVINNGTSTFKGVYDIGLYNLDGTLAQAFDVIYENNGLPPGYVYTAPFLTFSSSEITVDPGTYLLAVLHNPDNTGWQLTGSTNYQNPIKVIVTEAGFKPDLYENNNLVSQACSLSASFTGDLATGSTDGSNINVTTDNDFYKILLPAGYNYAISPRLHDSYNSGNGIVYSVDALFSYSIDGSQWSSAFDDIMTGNFVLKGGGTAYFHVAPYFAGETGTYLLDISIRRTSALGVPELETDELIAVFPNPAVDFMTIDLSRFRGQIRQVNLINNLGQIAVSKIPLTENSLNLSLADLPDGVYTIQFRTNNGIMTKKIVKGK